VKSCIGSASGQEILNEGALLFIHRDVPVNAEDVLGKLAHNKKGGLI